MGYLLGYDAGSSFIKATLLDADTGEVVAAASSPPSELEMAAPRPGWAEQDPEAWWKHLARATSLLRGQTGIDLRDVMAIGISYQMHGLVLVGRDLAPLRPAIIWCDSRAVPVGEAAFSSLGEETCLRCLLNSPGNFTASRLAWVKDNEPDFYARVYKMMLPGDYLAMRMSGEAVTTPSGLSEMILWDFEKGEAAELVLDYYGISPSMLPEVRPTFAVQGELTPAAAEELGLEPATPVAFRAGDQPSNALSLAVLNPGEFAANAGTSGVIYGVTSEPRCDPQSRVNTFVHVNHRGEDPRYGVLLCVNGTGILNRWLKRNLVANGEPPEYPVLNQLASSAPAGCEGLIVLPYGNGAERTLGNRNIGASVHGLDLNLHTGAHLLRAAQEGIVFALNYGLEIMRGMGMEMAVTRAGEANMFLSPLFGETFATVTGVALELYDADGSQGAARGAGLGAGIYHNMEDAFVGLRRSRVIEPAAAQRGVYAESYARWREVLMAHLD